MRSKPNHPSLKSVCLSCRSAIPQKIRHLRNSQGFPKCRSYPTTRVLTPLPDLLRRGCFPSAQPGLNSKGSYLQDLPSRGSVPRPLIHVPSTPLGVAHRSRRRMARHGPCQVPPPWDLLHQLFRHNYFSRYGLSGLPHLRTFKFHGSALALSVDTRICHLPTPGLPSELGHVRGFHTSEIPLGLPCSDVLPTKVITKMLDT